ncbi:hypothetical protein IMSAGC019_03644 [Lachnospiraceae bacterium]|nr:hypothetical protein IMSAGC019_03644 [Lachnospiraceae bacterium]
MNKQRRKQIEKAFELIGEAEDILESAKSEEQDAYDNLPENFQYGERGEEMQNYIEMLDESIGYLSDAKSVVEQI